MTLVDVIERARDLLQPLGESAIVDVYTSPWSLGVIVLAPLLEKLVPVDRQQPLISAGLMLDAGYFVLSAVFRLAVMSVYVAALQALYDRYLGFLTLHSLNGAPMAARVAVAVMFTDFVAWFHHWVRHKVPWLWHFHAVHHSQREMNLFTDVRVHPIDRLAAQAIMLVPMAMVEASFPVMVTFTFVHQAYTKLYHANARLRLGPLRYVLVTPQSHRIHHSAQQEHYDANYGVIFSIWDRLFRTQHADDVSYPPTGAIDPSYPHPRSRHPLELLRAMGLQLWHPFAIIAADVRARWRRRGPVVAP